MALPILAMALLRLVPPVFQIFDRVFKTYDRINNIVRENVHGIRVVKSFVRAKGNPEVYRRFLGHLQGSLQGGKDHHPE